MGAPPRGAPASPEVHMPDTLPAGADVPDTGAPARDLAVAEIRSTIVDVPTVRRHKLSNTSVTAQNYVVVQVRLANGAEGIGEAATLGGPRWSEESVEAMKANIDAYLAPAVMGQRADRFEAVGARMDGAAKRNNAAKAAIETALFDAVGKMFGLPACALLGGAVRDRVPVLWTLASGDPAQEVEEAERKLDARLHRTFKVKIGALAPEADMARMRHLARALLVGGAALQGDDVRMLRGRLEGVLHRDDPLVGGHLGQGRGEQGGLPGAVRADQRDFRAFADSQADSPE